MNCNKIASVDDVALPAVCRIYEQSFPIDERRDIPELLELLSSQQDFSLYAICDAHGVVGMLSSWMLDGWMYIEHFAIDEAARGKGIGREVLRMFLSNSVLPVVLEVEPPTDLATRRRITFYRSEGFELHDTYRYIQPSYGEGRSTVELRLMTYCAPDACNLDDLAHLLHRRVYGVCDV